MQVFTRSNVHDQHTMPFVRAQVKSQNRESASCWTADDLLAPGEQYFNVRVADRSVVFAEQTQPSVAASVEMWRESEGCEPRANATPLLETL